MAASKPIGEDKRLALLERLTELLGKEEARTLMESLPPVLWTHLATKDDLCALEDRLRTEFNGQFAKLNAKFDTGFAALNAKIDGGFASIEGRFANIEGRFANIEGRFAKVDAAFESQRAETTLQLAKQTRAMVVILIGFALSVWIPMLIIGLS